MDLIFAREFDHAILEFTETLKKHPLSTLRTAYRMKKMYPEDTLVERSTYRLADWHAMRVAVKKDWHQAS
ncbi:MAG: hypothetical protein AAGA02_04195 [Bacteroidota bacterium]